MKKNLVKPSPRVVGLCLLLGVVLLAAILNLPASAEPPEPTATPLAPVDVEGIEAPTPLEPELHCHTQPSQYQPC